MSLEIRAGAFENPKDPPSVCSLLKSHGFKNADFGRIGNALLLKGAAASRSFIAKRQRPLYYLLFFFMG